MICNAAAAKAAKAVKAAKEQRKWSSASHLITQSGTGSSELRSVDHSKMG